MKRRSRSKSAPRYRHYKRTNQAAVTIHGKDIYLGEYDSEESHERYRRTLTELWSSTGDLKSKVRKSDDRVTISYLAVEYAKHAKSYYQKNGKPTSEWSIVQIVLKKLRAAYGSLPVEEFGPVRYKHFRQTFFIENLIRTTINHYMLHVKLMFEHGVEHELIPVECYQRLKCVGNLKQGRTEAKEPKKIKPVDDSVVEATMEKLTPVVRDMVVLQRLTGMRPGELTQDKTKVSATVLK
jgi:integrase